MLNRAMIMALFLANALGLAATESTANTPEAATNEALAAVTPALGGVPKAVKDALMAAHPDAQNVKWEKEGKNWEGEFQRNGREISVEISADGTILATESELKNGEYPSAINDYLASNFADYELEEVMKVESNGTLGYEVEIEVNEKGREMLFDANGQFQKNVSEAGEQDEEDEEEDDD